MMEDRRRIKMFRYHHGQAILGLRYVAKAAPRKVAQGHTMIRCIYFSMLLRTPSGALWSLYERLFPQSATSGCNDYWGPIGSRGDDRTPLRGSRQAGKRLVRARVLACSAENLRAPPSTTQMPVGRSVLADSRSLRTCHPIDGTKRLRPCSEFIIGRREGGDQPLRRRGADAPDDPWRGNTTT
ncbi:hypothetical protein LZ32DRAFT_316645 [Colletotrichum eremochloae]|nr:hypothetical protein LZ32DRAFT_316645 [Colletotrichum eremochloae]